jgi:ABC-type multidrug transport system ATPase subunit
LEPVGSTSTATPAQTVAKSLADRDVPGYQRAARTAEALELLDLYDTRDTPLRELGATARTCAAIAAGIAHRPAVLLLDNVTSALPQPLKGRLHQFLNGRRDADGLTVIHATTSTDEAESAGRVVLMDAGAIVEVGTPRELQERFGRTTFTIEAAEPAAIRRALRETPNLIIEEHLNGIRISTAESATALAYLLRHPPEGFQSVFVRHASLWDIHESACRQHSQVRAS